MIFLVLRVSVFHETRSTVFVLFVQVWVHEQYRRQGVATRLADAVREKMVYGISLRRDQVRAIGQN